MDGSGDERNGASEGARFDASQYAFFGEDIVEEIELGGLEEDEDENFASMGIVESKFPPQEEDRAQDEVLGSLSEMDELAGAFSKDEVLGSLSEMDELAGAFSKLNNDGRLPRKTGVIHESDTFLPESSAAGLLQDVDSSDWLEQQITETDNIQKRWQSRQSSLVFAEEASPIIRMPTYPQRHSQESNFGDPVLRPKSSFDWNPIPGHGSYSLPNESFSPSISRETVHGRLHISAPNNNSSTLHHLTAQNRVPFIKNKNQLISPVDHMNSHNVYPVDQSTLFPSFLQPNMPNHNGQHHHNRLINARLFSQQEQQSRPVQPSPASLFRPQLLNSHYLPPAINKIEPVHGVMDMRDERAKFPPRRRENLQFSHHLVGNNSHDGYSWPQFKGMYMSSEEIEHIVRMQLAATHSNDPYTDDYYHQACLAKRSAGQGFNLKHHFCPSSIMDVSSRAHANNEPHPYLHVDALGRIAFSSIRRPRPLLEIESLSTSDNQGSEGRSELKSLEEEPMLAARIVIEENLCLILDIDDIDRMLQFGQPLDGASQLRQRRMVLLEGVASSLQLIDPFGLQNDGKPVGLAPKDDHVFLQISSLLKGRKFLLRYLQLLSPGSELTRIICMAIFRHLQFLFGGSHQDSTVSETTSKLSEVVSFCIRGMDLNSLSACLAAMVCSPEKPSFRPIGVCSDDKASVVAKAVLDRATALLADPVAAQNFSIPTRALWQESFNAFFKLLTQYCFAKYDAAVQSLHGLNSVTTSDVSRVVSKEIPTEVLRSSLPHTDEQQRKLLLNFAQKSMTA